MFCNPPVTRRRTFCVGFYVVRVTMTFDIFKSRRILRAGNSTNASNLVICARDYARSKMRGRWRVTGGGLSYRECARQNEILPILTSMYCTSLEVLVEPIRRVNGAFWTEFWSTVRETLFWDFSTTKRPNRSTKVSNYD